MINTRRLNGASCCNFWKAKQRLRRLCEMCLVFRERRFAQDLITNLALTADIASAKSEMIFQITFVLQENPHYQCTTRAELAGYLGCCIMCSPRFLLLHMYGITS